MVLRMVNKGNGSMAYREAVKLVKEVTEGANVELVAFLISRGVTIWQLLPRSVHTWLRIAMNVRASHIQSITPDELHGAAMEARPDCAAVFNTEAGRKWLDFSFLPGERSA